MALDYFACIKCGAQEALPPEEFFKHAKLKSMLDMIEANKEELMAKDDRLLADVPIQLPWVFASEQFGERDKLLVGEAEEIWRGIEARWGGACRDCPVNMRREALGCFGAVNYPISAAGEEWLMAQFDPPEGEDDSYIAFHLKSSGVTGEGLESNRGRGLLARAAPATKRLSPEGGEYSSSQIIEYLLRCQPVLIPETLFGLCVDFRAVDIQGADLKMLHAYLSMEGFAGGGDSLSEKLGPDWKFQMTKTFPFVLRPDEADDGSVFRLKRFFYQCWRAFQSGGVLVIDG